MAETVNELKALLEKRTRELEACRERLRSLTRLNNAAEMFPFMEERFHSIFRNTSASMALTFPDGRFIEVNPAFCRFLGYTADELLQLTIEEITHPDDRNKIRTLRRNAAARLIRAFTVEKRYLRKDGATVWGHVSANWFYDDDGKPVYAVTLIQDITEQKRSEEALRQSEERFRSMFQHTSAGMVIISPHGDFLDANPAFCAFLGYRLDELLKLHAMDITHPADRNQTHDRLNEARTGARHTFNRGKRYLRKDGTTVWGQGVSTWFFDPEGNPGYAVAIIQDITDQKRAEGALRESEERFSKAFHATPSWLVISTLDEGRFIEFNEAFGRICGFSREEVVGRTALELDIWEDRADRAAIVQTLVQGGAVRDLEVNFRGKNGNSFVGLLSAELIEINGEKCLLTLVNDITARKRAELALRENEERFRRLYNDTPVMLHSICRDGKLLAVSNYWLEVLGYERDEVIGRKSSEFLTEESRRYAEEVVLPDYFASGFCKDVPYQFVTKSGKIIDVLLSATAERNEAGEVVRSLAVMAEVTERKRMEEKIEVLNTDLACRAAELEAANRELEAFSYTVSHDLRSPLTGIGGYCQVLLELCADRLGEQYTGYVREIHGAVQRMDQLITTLLNFSHLSRSEISRETVDLSLLAQTVAAGLKMNEPYRRVTFTIAPGLRAQGDAKLLMVVMENLVGNAWKYTGRQETARIEFGTVDVDGAPSYFVRDNGPGFAMSDADKLFTPFQRLHTAEKFAGHGIGLATVQRIIQRHGGQVWAEGEPGKGAAFFFSLP